MPLLEIKNLKLDFEFGDSLVRAVDGVSLSLEAGETLGLVGESGCGKSVTALSIARLLPSPPARYAGGEVRLEGRDVLLMSSAELRGVRGRVVSYVFQEPSVSLNPVMRIGDQILEALKLHRRQRANEEEVLRLLKLVGLPAPETRRKDYPFQMSGGMQQRVMLAIGLAAEPKLLVADEPTTALDVTLQAQMIDLLRDLQGRLGMALLFISHNLALLRGLAHTVATMYAGQIVEQGPTAEVLRTPLHPYTKALLASVPRLCAGGPRPRRLLSIPGNVPAPGQNPAGCRFYPRCPSRQPRCAEFMPELVEVAKGRWTRCWYVEPPQALNVRESEKSSPMDMAD